MCQQDGRCRFSKSNVGATVNSWCDIPQGDENALMQAANAIGPISVAIDASSFSFQLYGGGNDRYFYNNLNKQSQYMLKHAQKILNNI